MTDAYALAQLSKLNDAWKRWVPPNGSEAHQNIIALDMAIQALREREKRKTPCDLCAYNPPSSCDGKPCTMCPACAKEDAE